jgi:hypothetical protein
VQGKRELRESARGSNMILVATILNHLLQLVRETILQPDVVRFAIDIHSELQILSSFRLILYPSVAT